ncbi:MAG: tyrosine--tRNA ligase [Pseudomonadota bacterium]|nr:tyrosine--tRNA ligase [Pseudomonadota bacterium]
MTYAPKSEFLRTVIARGLLQDCTDLEGLDDALMAGVVPGYIGFDCTADSLHVGHLTGIMLLRWLQKTGHKPIALMGGGTTRIGDPSGKDEARQLLTDEIINANMAGIRTVFASYLDFEETGGNAVQPNNAEWLNALNYIDFLRDYGRHFTINRMLSFDSVKLRLDREQPLTFLEFNYMLLQAYDFLELNRRQGCLLQMGGSDQWGNIVNGVELTRRVDGKQVFGLTAPLLTKSDGSKMGKTAGGAVWLNEDRLGHFEFWQYWRNVEDAQVGLLLRRFTELPLDECDRLGALEGSEINAAKVILANEVTALARGRAAAEAAEATAREVFEQGGAGEELPTFDLTAEEAGAGVSVAQLFVRAGLAKSGKDAKRLIAEGGARLADAPVTDAGQMVGADAFAAGPVKLSAGKKRHALVRIG